MLITVILVHYPAVGIIRFRVRIRLEFLIQSVDIHFDFIGIGQFRICTAILALSVQERLIRITSEHIPVGIYYRFTSDIGASTPCTYNTHISSI